MTADVIAAEVPACLVAAGVDPVPAAAVLVKANRVPARAGREALAAIGKDLLPVAATHALPANKVQPGAEGLAVHAENVDAEARVGAGALVAARAGQVLGQRVGINRGVERRGQGSGVERRG